MVKYILVVFMLFAAGTLSVAKTVQVSLFNDHTISTLVVSSVKGNYKLMADGNELLIAGENEIVYITMMDKNLLVRDQTGSFGVFSRIGFSALDSDGLFSIRPVKPSMNVACYHGNAEFSVDFERVRIINEVDEDTYLAGVVEAESGTAAHLMYYRAHAIICRTYLYGNFKRHADENFDLCDEVHCQVYKGRLTGNETIHEAVNLTKGKVIIYGEEGLITAAFHANCGGETVNPEEVWLARRPYLRAVKDPFCLERPNAGWVRSIDAGEWEMYLVGMGLDYRGRSFSSTDFISRQQGRSSLYRVDRFTIPYRKIRSDWDFRSAWFSIEPGPGMELLVRGRGYGHGVGLCQEGAMEMARRGYNFMQILEFYYTNIKVVNTEEVND